MAILSYDGHVTFGLIADRHTVPDLAILKQGIEDELADLPQPRFHAARAAPRGADDLGIRRRPPATAGGAAAA